MKVLLWGTCDKGKPRTRILLEGLRAAGCEITEIHRDVWAGIEDKSQLGALARARRYLGWLVAYPGLLVRFMAAQRPDVVFLAYPAQIDVLVLWLAARLRRVPIAMDLFISLYDTAVIDRGLAGRKSIKARLIRGLEWLSCRAADRLLIDTAPHARYVEELFALRPRSVGSVPVGAEPGDFPWQPPARSGGRPRVLFYGQLIPLHGIRTVLEAALSDRGRAFDWMIIGSGQETSVVEAALGPAPPGNVSWKRWVPYEDLAGEILRSDLCLGIFGTSRKAASVVPNKVYQCLASGRHVVTRASPAMAELVPGGDPGLTLVEAGSAEALLDGIEAARTHSFAAPSPDLASTFTVEAIGQRLLAELVQARR